MNDHQFPPYFDWVAHEYLRLGVRSYTKTGEVTLGNYEVLAAMRKAGKGEDETKALVKKKRDGYRRRVQLD